jgi:hypothetical protein
VDGLARYALIACIVTSALGGLVITVLVFRFGLAPPEVDEPLEVTHRRLFASHLGHALATVAFALSALLAAVALLVQPPASRIAAEQAAEQTDVYAIAQRLNRVEDLVRRMTETLDQTVERFERLDRTRAAR